MKRLFFIIPSVLILAIFAHGASAREIHFFYGEGCPHCAKADAFLEELEQERPGLEVNKYEVYLDPGNLELYQEYCDRYGIDPVGVPMTFIEDEYFIGFGAGTGDEIDAYLEALDGAPASPEEEGALRKKEETEMDGGATGLTWTKVVSLAAVDAVNPCALAVLILMLTAILAYNPRDRKNIILAGLAFVLAVFIMYMIYGLIIIKFFQLVEALTAVRLWLYKILGVVAIILGVLNIRDFFTYRPGRLGTEMPLFMRPGVKRIISGITSPWGAFGVGLFVTLFLLPCTIGPYVIAGGILSAMAIAETIVPLLVYNLIFILPMLTIIVIVYIGFRKVEDVSAWKERHVTKLHLAAGLIMIGLGVAMVFGWV